MSGDEGSDMEMGHTDGMQADDDSDGSYEPPEPASELPDGISKEIITKSEDNYRKPKAGDEIFIRYKGTLKSDGAEFDSCTSDEPLKFFLGKGEVIKGLDLGIETMRKGEVAKFTFEPEFAYGETPYGGSLAPVQREPSDGSASARIPPGATLVFEVELLRWVSREDLFKDGGVIKCVTKEGSGWKMPKQDEEVLLSLKACSPDGSVIEERARFDYKLGSDVLGPIGKTVDKALSTMKKDEEVSLICAKDYAYGDSRPDGVTIDMVFHELYEIKDVSFNKDKSIMKKQIRQGEGWESPKDSATVTMKAEVQGGAPTDIVFTCGNGDVCDVLECAALEMKKGERAVVKCTKPELAIEPKLGISGAAGPSVVITLELVDIVKPKKETWDMSEVEKIEFGASRKDVGAALFKAGRISLALQRYKQVCELFGYVDNMADENKAKAKLALKACELNKAACCLKLGDHAAARKACDAVLKDDRTNVKGLYRRAQANLALKSFQDCMRDLKVLLAEDAQNKEARVLLKQAQAGQKEEDRKAKGMFANMCKALGKGPIPEPGKSVDPAGMDDDMGSEDDSMGAEDEAAAN